MRNPLMLLDEIDKVSSDYKGDTASALLGGSGWRADVNFRDHYLEVPLDLSEVLFIATANEPERISRPLLDRMEIIELSSYTENEKFHIAKQYLIRKQRKANGIQKKQVHIPDEVIYEIIRSYTREAGVRDLERRSDGSCGKAGPRDHRGAGDAWKYMWRIWKTFSAWRHTRKKRRRRSRRWALSVAWRGPVSEEDTLSIEVNVMPGKGKLALTGPDGRCDEGVGADRPELYPLHRKAV